jgi:hypothetical protein
MGLLLEALELRPELFTCRAARHLRHGLWIAFAREQTLVAKFFRATDESWAAHTRSQRALDLGVTQVGSTLSRHAANDGGC